ncbi:hypothetical protein [Cellulosimicrobium sp. CUA-896]|uniref:hypothetical protein n=1 Tax=Cellulosimicrobium sp. CUA-896 TaxID=1517881 RepID=UPI002101C6CC|nr:hypothetical protein [Cellulosimicrobium sp. CUA-896]
MTVDGVTVDLDQVSGVTRTAGPGAPADPGSPAASDGATGTTSTPASGDAA